MGGMCCTSNTGTRRLAGSCGIKLASACGPPVETPIPRIWKGASRLTARPDSTAQPGGTAGAGLGGSAGAGAVTGAKN